MHFENSLSNGDVRSSTLSRTPDNVSSLCEIERMPLLRLASPSSSSSVVFLCYPLSACVGLLLMLDGGHAATDVRR